MRAGSIYTLYSLDGAENRKKIDKNIFQIIIFQYRMHSYSQLA